jgi:hypothetical protein
LVFLCSAFLWRPAAAAADATAVSAPSTCHKDFDQFLRAFGSSEQVQRQWTRFPLPVQYFDISAQPEPKPRVKTLSRKNAKFPLMRLDAEREEKHLRLKVTRQTATSREVLLQQDDTDWMTYYHFAYIRCWRLVRIDDHSL